VCSAVSWLYSASACSLRYSPFYSCDVICRYTLCFKYSPVLPNLMQWDQANEETKKLVHLHLLKTVHSVIAARRRTKCDDTWPPWNMLTLSSVFLNGIKYIWKADSCQVSQETRSLWHRTRNLILMATRARRRSVIWATFIQSTSHTTSL
jgi:hypothetical protein